MARYSPVAGLSSSFSTWSVTAQATTLSSKVIVEPACGAGAFLIPVVERLLASCRLHGQEITQLTKAVRAYDLLESNVELARKAVVQLLVEDGCSVERSESLAETWVTTADFLLTRARARFRRTLLSAIRLT